MSTTNSECNTVIPNGTQIPTSSVIQLINQGVPVQISFMQSRPNAPLPPLVQSFYSEGKLQVCAVVFINIETKIDQNSISVFWNQDVECPNFYVSYDAPEVTSTTFLAYQVNFNLHLETQPSTINTVVWDEDPVGSRGTVTTVQP